MASEIHQSKWCEAVVATEYMIALTKISFGPGSIKLLLLCEARGALHKYQHNDGFIIVHV